MSNTAEYSNVKGLAIIYYFWVYEFYRYRERYKGTKKKNPRCK